MIEQTYLEIAKASMYNIALIGNWIIFITTFAIMGLIFKSKNSKWGNFWTTWFLSVLISGTIVTFLIIAPEQINNFIEQAKNWIN